MLAYEADLARHQGHVLVRDSCIVEAATVTDYDTGRRTCRDSCLLIACLETDLEVRVSAWVGNRPYHGSACLDLSVTLSFGDHHIDHPG